MTHGDLRSMQTRVKMNTGYRQSFGTRSQVCGGCSMTSRCQSQDPVFQRRVYSQGVEVTKQKIACAVQRAVISCVEMQNDWDSLQVMVK